MQPNNLQNLRPVLIVQLLAYRLFTDLLEYIAGRVPLIDLHNENLFGRHLNIQLHAKFSGLYHCGCDPRLHFDLESPMFLGSGHLELHRNVVESIEFNVLLATLGWLRQVLNAAISRNSVGIKASVLFEVGVLITFVWRETAFPTTFNLDRLPSLLAPLVHLSELLTHFEGESILHVRDLESLVQRH